MGDYNLPNMFFPDSNFKLGSSQGLVYLRETADKQLFLEHTPPVRPSSSSSSSSTPKKIKKLLPSLDNRFFLRFLWWQLYPLLFHILSRRTKRTKKVEERLLTLIAIPHCFGAAGLCVRTEGRRIRWGSHSACCPLPR